MGTFGGYKGGMKIPKDKKELFAQQMSKLLNFGGMMQFEEVSMYGHDMGLLKPIEIYPGGKVCFHYNYFEDEPWETAGFDADRCKLWSGKIGGAEFNDVIMAGYMLYEAYDEDIGMAEVDGEIIRSAEYMGWINNILGTTFSMIHRFNLWENAEKSALIRLENKYEEVFPMREFKRFIPKNLTYAAAGTEFADLMYIMQGTFDLCEKEIVRGSYPEDVYKCKKLLKHYFQNNCENSIEKLWDLLKKNCDLRKMERDEQLLDIARMSLIIPARVFVYLTAEIKGNMQFWEIWKELKNLVYHDECMKKYASDDLIQWRKSERERPIEPVPTSVFLRQNGYFTFFQTPEELEGTPDYFLSDDDRLYWWDGTDEVKISKDTDKWLKELGQQHKELMTTENFKKIKLEFQKYFLLTIIELDDCYKRIYPFQTMFYEFLQHGMQEEYIAAVVLLKKLADSEEYRKAGEIIKYARISGWYITSRNVTHNYARIHLKRYLSVMANVRLRKKYFGF